MTGKSLFNNWKWTLAALAAAGGAFYVHSSAWQAGHDAMAVGLLGLLFLRSLLLLAAWFTVVAAFQDASGYQMDLTSSRFTFLHLVVLVLILPGCVGCFAAWPGILAILALMYLSLLVARRSVLRSEAGLVVVRPGLTVLLFVMTWYLSASVTHQAYLGLGQRIEDKVGAEKLHAWATEVIEAHDPEKEADKAPEFITDLLGPNQGVRSFVVVDRPEPSVALYTGGSAFHFRILVTPSRAGTPPEPSWVRDQAEMEWRPGIVLSTEGK